MIAAEACAAAACVVVIVRPEGALERYADLKGVVAASLPRIHTVNSSAIRAGIEVTACARLDVVAPGLHVPKQSFAQLCGRSLIRKNSFHTEYRGDRDR